MSKELDEAMRAIESEGSPPGWMHDIIASELRRQSQELERAREALILAERWFDSSRVSHHRECAGASPIMPCDCGVRATMAKITAALTQPAPEKP
jgi:hypothetical protein